MLSRFAANTIYVQVRRNSFRLRFVEAHKDRDVPASTPFTTTRLLVGEFKEAEALLRRAFYEEFSGKLFTPSPVVVIHPMEMVDGGLCEVEERLFRELAAGAGARKVFVHLGPALSDAEVLGKCERG